MSKQVKNVAFNDPQKYIKEKYMSLHNSGVIKKKEKKFPYNKE